MAEDDPDRPEPEPAASGSSGPEPSGEPAPSGEPDPDPPDPELAGAVEDALKPVERDAVMAIWERVVLGRLMRSEGPAEGVEELRRRLDEDPDDPPAP